MFKQVEPGVSFPEVETEVLDFWRSEQVFEKSLSLRAGSPRFTFYEGPPTANNKPGLHHVWARVFKDVFCRYKTMRGFSVPRKGGWDCHGLPVEVEVEKSLGITSKQEIEEFGVEDFNRRCRDSVRQYVVDWERLTERIGFWLDTENAYWTMSDDYVESVWWQLGQMWDAGLLYDDFKVVPYCPRCGTALSSAEVAQGYQDVEDLSAFVKFPLVADPEVSLIVWTTTPWTLVSNVGVAVHPDETYIKAEVDGESYIVAKSLAPSVLGEDFQTLDEFRGADLSGTYIRPFDYLTEEHAPAYSVVHATFVTMDEGTGLVHLAPAFGEIDREVGREYGLPAPNPVDAEGRFATGPHAGKFVRDANEALVEELKDSGRLYKAQRYTHSYPHCWRCATPLIYWAKSSWYIRTTSRKDRMIEENRQIGWHPPHIRDGRFGDWLENNIDWSLSRDRYWGTPLPIWQCAEGHATFVKSRTELSELSGQDCHQIDPHRPYIDKVEITCPHCGSTARRVKPVLDAWFDSGSMPAAQWGYPYGDASETNFDAAFPADFICEAIDQTRGWFYSLLAVSTLVFDSASYRNVLCLGHIVDAEGKKMSKSIGNIIDPWTILDSRGADPLRWFFFSSGSPWTPSRVSTDAIDKSTSNFLLTLWNTYSFFVTYALADGWEPGQAPQVEDRPSLDEWILARLTATQIAVSDAMDSFDALNATKALAAFVGDLSNWYVRRSRRRFWSARSQEPGDTLSKESAYQTLHRCLVVTSQLLAPFCPFVADALWLNLAGPESVHLSDWPEPDHHLRRPALEAGVEVARKIVGLGRAARTESKVRTRQPLARAIVVAPEDDRSQLTDELTSTITEELNVDRIEFAPTMAQLVDVEVKPDFRALGPRLGKKVQALAGVLAKADSESRASQASQVEAGHHVVVEVDGETVSLSPDELEVRRAPREGFAVISEQDYCVALDLEINASLRMRGTERELTHAIQGLRKSAGLDVSDRIRLWLMATAGSEAEAVIEQAAEEIASELLAVEFQIGNPSSESVRAEFEVNGDIIEVGLIRAD